MQPPPELVVLDPRSRLDPRQRARVAHVPFDLAGRRSDHLQAGGHVLGERLERARRTGRPLRSSARPTNSTSQLIGLGLRLPRRAREVDAVGDDLVLAAEPAPAGPARRLGDGDPGVKLVELAAGADQRRGVVGPRLGRVGVEGADDGRPAVRAGVPPGHRRHRLVDVDDVRLERRRGSGEAPRRPGETSRGSRPSRSRRSRRVRPRLQTLSGSSVTRGSERWSMRVIRSGGSNGAMIATSWPRSASAPESASTWRFTPPG